MTLSIIIPVFNGERYISRCLTSIIDQGLKKQSFEVLVFDDGSSDNTAFIVKEFAALHPEVKLIQQPNQGQGACRNQGIAMACGKYIYCIDADDYLVGRDFLQLLSCMQELDLQVITFLSKVVRGNGVPDENEDDLYNYLKTTPKILNGRQYIANHSYKNEVWWFIAQREYLLNNNFKFIEGRFMEDVVFTTGAILNADRILQLPIYIHRYVKDDQSTLGNKNPAHYIKVIKDMDFLIHQFSSIVDEAKRNFPQELLCIERLKTRQDSFVFFMIVRALKSQISFKELWHMLMGIKKTGSYPMKHFVSAEYNSISYKVLTPLFNRKTSLYLLAKAFNWAKIK